MRKHIMITILLGAFAALSLGAFAFAGNDQSERRPSSGDARRAAQEAVRAAHGGTVTSVDHDTENGAAWEVEVTMPDGSRVDVLLDSRFRLIDVSDQREPNEKRKSDSVSDRSSKGDKDTEKPVDSSDAARAGRAALDAVGGGTVQDVDLDNENGAVWEVEIIREDGTPVDVLVDQNFKVISVGGEQEPNEGADDSNEDGD